jgi:uncharacterized RDD family membrane protein YckC
MESKLQENRESVTEPKKTKQKSIYRYWFRLLAFIVDCTLLWIIGITIGTIFNGSLSLISYWGRLAGLIIVLGYFGVLNSYLGKGQTIGKRLFKIKVVTKDGIYISFTRSILRTLILAIPFFLFGMMFPKQVVLSPDSGTVSLVVSIVIWIFSGGIVSYYLFNRKTQRSFHDICCGTFVVKEQVSELNSINRISILSHAMFFIYVLFVLTIAIMNFTMTDWKMHMQFKSQQALLYQIKGISAAEIFFDSINESGKFYDCLHAQVYLSEKPESFEVMAAQVARTLMNTSSSNPYFYYLDVQIITGYDIGIAQNRKKHQLQLTKEGWENKFDEVLSKGLAKYHYFPKYIHASSYLQSTWNRFEENYLPEYLFDNRPTSAWVEDGKGENASGINEFLSFSGLVVKQVKVLKLKIRNGYQKSEALYLANSRPRELELYINGEGWNYNIPNQSKPRYIIELTDVMGWQDFSFPLNQDLKSIMLRIKAIYPGTKYDDTCISDIQIAVTTDRFFDLDHTLENKAANESFISERLIKAKNMAKFDNKGLVKLNYSLLAQSLVKSLPIPEGSPMILSEKYPAKDPTFDFKFRFMGYNSPVDTVLTDEEIRHSLYLSIDQLNTYPQAIRFISWIDNIKLDSFEVSKFPVNKSFINETKNNFDTPFDSSSGKSLLLRFLKYDANNNEELIAGDNKNPKVKFFVTVGLEQWQGYASKYYITPCCCGGGPRWVYEFELYDQEGYIKWKYRNDQVEDRISFFYIWNKKIPQIERVCVLKDIDFQEGMGTFPGRMEIWE